MIVRFSQTVRQPTASTLFGGKVHPTLRELSGIQQALQGWPNHPDYLGTSHVPSLLLVEELLTCLAQDGPLSAARFDELARQKTRVMNLNALILNKPLVYQQDQGDGIREFLTALTREMTDTKRVFRENFGFTPAMIDVYERFVAETAPTLFLMGFPDAIPHAAQVSRLCVIQAAKLGAEPEELLQAAIVGWLHDPKFPNDYSWSNLATHPVIGAAIAEQVLTQGEAARLLKVFLASRPGVKVKGFVRGVVEALSINNDSGFVLKNVILRKPPFPVPGHPEPALLDQMEWGEGCLLFKKNGDSVQLIGGKARRLEQLMWDRFAAPAAGKKLKRIPRDLVESLSFYRLKTGIRGFSKLSWLVDRLEAFPTRLFELALDGNLPVFLATHLSGLIGHVRGAVVEPKVSGLTLLSHHDEATHARKAGIALAASDPLLLSFHKLLEGERNQPLLAVVGNFVRSFEENIAHLPAIYQTDGRCFQRAVYLSILKTAEELNGKEVQAAVDVLPGDILETPCPDTLKQLVERLQAPVTWGETGRLQYSKAAEKQFFSDLETVVTALQKNYNEVLKAYRTRAFEKYGNPT